MTADDTIPTPAEPAAPPPHDAPTPDEPVVADAIPSSAPSAAGADEGMASEELGVVEAVEPAAPEVPASNKRWYVIKVTSGREESIKAAIERRVRIEGLEEFFGQLVIPVERVTEIRKVREKRGDKETFKEKRVVKERKKFPGYLMAEVEYNDRILYLVRETSGVGDFVGATGPLKPPPPMSDNEVRRMMGEAVPDEKKPGGKKVVKLDFEKGDKVRIREGAFANMEGEVKVITEPKEDGDTPKVTVEVLIFGRGVPVELDYWQVDKNCRPWRPGPVPAA